MKYFTVLENCDFAISVAHICSGAYATGHRIPYRRTMCGRDRSNNGLKAFLFLQASFLVAWLIFNFVVPRLPSTSRPVTL